MEQSTQVARKRAARLPGSLIPRSFFEHSPERVAPLLLGKLLVHRTPAGVIAGRIIEVEAYLGPHNKPPDPAAHAHRGPTPRNSVLFGPAGHAYVYSIYGQYFCMNISCETEGRAGSVLLRALEPVTGIDLMAANRWGPRGQVFVRGVENRWGPRGQVFVRGVENRWGPRGQVFVRGVENRGPHGQVFVRGAKNRGLSADASHKLLTSGPGRLCQALGITRPTHNGIDLTEADSILQVRDDGYEVPKALVTVRIGLTHAIDWPLRFVVEGHICASGPKSLNGRVRPAR